MKSVAHIVFVLLGVFMLSLTPSRTHAQTAPAPVELRVMTFNIWVGGELVDFGKVVEAIQLSQADVVGLQEPSGNTRRLADALGWQHANERLHIISKYPLIDPPNGNGQFIYVQVRPGQVVALMNVHLPSDPYGPYLVRDGESLETVLQNERELRLAAIETVLARLPELQQAGIPTMLTGDFNTPSHLDWTAEVVATNPQRLYPVEWLVSKAVEASGMTDTYRAIHPNPVTVPGNTWTYGYPHPRLLENEMIDRIDFVYASNDVRILESQIVGERDGQDVGIGVLPFPSDHRGVVSTVELIPGVMPILVAPQQRRVEQGERLVVHYATPNGETAGDRISIVATGENALAPLMWLPPYEASFFGSVTFGTGNLPTGEYDTVLTDADGNELARQAFWVVEMNARPSLTTNRPTYAAGEPIVVSWNNAPAQQFDWVAIYSANEPDLYNNYWAYAYTQATVNGSTAFDESVLGESLLPGGDYVARLLLDDAYSVIAEVAFRVVE